MDSAQGAAPAVGTAGDVHAGGDGWRSHVQPDHAKVVNKMMETLVKRLPVLVPERWNKLKRIVVQCEEKIYAAARSQSEYLQKISLKTLALENQTRAHLNPQNVQAVQNQRPHGLASVASTAQSAYPDAGNWQEELYQMIKSMKNKYLPELSDLYNKVSMKLQHIDNHRPSQKLTEMYERMKIFKSLLEQIMQFLQMDKSCVLLAHKVKLPAYESKIVSILNSKKRKLVQTPEQSAVQTLSCSASGIPLHSPTQTGYPGAGDLHELYQMKTLKDQYRAGLRELYEISTKLHANSDMASQKPKDQDDEMKSFKLILHRSLHSMQIGKGSVQPAHEESIPMYKSQIASILNSDGWKPEQTIQQSGAHSTGPSEESCMPSGILSPERSNVKRLRPCLNDDTRS